MRKEYLKEVILNSIIVFVSYILAVVIRYRILHSDPGINALSAPYLMIALMYSILLACTLDYGTQASWFEGKGSLSGLYQMISKNSVGCLLLLAAFYIAGIVYFSRWALLLFWILSSVGLIGRRGIAESRIARARCDGKDPYYVLIIGDGDMADDYIKSVFQNTQFGIKIIGYMGNSDRLRTDVNAIFDIENYPEPIIEWLGEYRADELENRVEGLDEVVIADHFLSDETTKEILTIAHRAGVKTSLSMRYSPLILNETKIRSLGESKLLGLNETTDEPIYYSAGIVISAAILLLTMIMKKFNTGALYITLKGLESSRSIVFGLFGFFLFINLTSFFRGRKLAFLKRGALAWVICAGAIVVFEVIYGAAVLPGIGIDLLIISVVLAPCTVIAGISEMIEQSDYIFWE